MFREHPIIATWKNTNSNMDAEKVHYMTYKQHAGAGCDKNTNLKCSCDWKFKRTIYRVSVRETDVSWQFCLFTTQNTTLFVNSIYISWTYNRHMNVSKIIMLVVWWLLHLAVLKHHCQIIFFPEVSYKYLTLYRV